MVGHSRAVRRDNSRVIARYFVRSAWKPMVTREAVQRFTGGCRGAAGEKRQIEAAARIY